jgi:hypothetical protein
MGNTSNLREILESLSVWKTDASAESMRIFAPSHNKKFPV